MYANTYHRHARAQERGKYHAPAGAVTTNALYNELTFYPAFGKDLSQAKREVIIYSPFVSKYRSETVFGAIAKLTARNIDVFIFTRPVEEYERRQQDQIRAVHARLEELGAFVFCLHGAIHEKTAIIDREILWEGSLNILSQRESREMMRRTESEEMANQVLRYLRLEHKLAEGYKVKYEQLYRSLLGENVQRRSAGTWLFWGISIGMIVLTLYAVGSNTGIMSLLQLLRLATLK